MANHIDDGRRVSLYFRALLSSIGIPEDSPNFYALRHTFVTVAMQPRDKDKEAIRSITGHGPNGRDMLDEYNEEDVADARLLAVSNHVHDWLFKKESPLSGADTGEHVVSTVGLAERPRYVAWMERLGEETPGTYAASEKASMDRRLAAARVSERLENLPARPSQPIGRQDGRPVAEKPLRTALQQVTPAQI